MAFSTSLPSEVRAPNKQEISAGTVWLGRLGLAARGAVYLMVGYLAVQAAVGSASRRATDQGGAVEAISELPWGDLLLWIVVAGLVGYVVWRLGQAIFDLDHYGRDRKGAMKRVAAFVSACTYGALAFAAAKFALGGAMRSGERSTEDKTQWLMEQPFGRWLVGAVGLIIIIVALYQFKQAFSCGFARRLRGHELTAEQEKWSVRAGRFGHAARGVAFGLISWFFLQAALHSDASEAGGLSAALNALSRHAHGPWLLGIVGVGLGLFGVYSLVESRYRRIG
ncbi:MAG TPA: DUF1206 domain-containing protein [Chthoniobacteraceae bacterium]